MRLASLHEEDDYDGLADKDQFDGDLDPVMEAVYELGRYQLRAYVRPVDGSRYLRIARGSAPKWDGRYDSDIALNEYTAEYFGRWLDDIYQTHFPETFKGYAGYPDKTRALKLQDNLVGWVRRHGRPDW